MSAFRTAMKTFLYAITPVSLGSSQYDDWQCPFCEQGFQLGGTAGRVTRKVRNRFREAGNHRKSCVFIKALLALGEPEVLDNGASPADSKKELVRVVSFLRGLREQARAQSKRERKGLHTLDCRFLDLEALPDVVSAPEAHDFCGPVFQVGDMGLDYHGQGPEFDELRVSAYDLIGGPEGVQIRAREARRGVRIQLVHAQHSAKWTLSDQEKYLDKARKDLASGETGGKQADRNVARLAGAVSKAKATLRGATEALAAFDAEEK
jgi:hypothetical protein